MSLSQTVPCPHCDQSLIAFVAEEQAWVARVCPGSCNRAWRRAQSDPEWAEKHPGIEPYAGDPVWCEQCLDEIRRALRRFPDLAVWLWDRGHGDGDGVDLGRLSTVRAERSAPSSGSPSLSPSWDAVDELVTWVARVEDKARARLGHEARDADWWTGTTKQRTTILSTSVLWLLSRNEVWSLPEAEQWGREVLRMDRRAEKLSGRDELVHHLGVCPHCDKRALVRFDGDDWVRCQACRRKWSEDEWQWMVRVAVQAEQEG